MISIVTSTWMHQITYTSQASGDLSYVDIVQIVHHARWANAAQQITSLLVYGSGLFPRTGQFLQIMEGEETVLRAAYRRMGQDGRHRQLVTLTDKVIAARDFADCPLAFHYLLQDQFAKLTDRGAPPETTWIPAGLAAADQGLLRKLRSILLADSGS